MNNTKYCSPKSHIDNSISCYSKKTLKNIARQYNKNHEDKILIPTNINNEKELKDFWAEILNKINEKYREKKNVYSVLNEEPHEQDFVTFGLLILKPEPIRLSI